MVWYQELIFIDYTFQLDGDSRTRFFSVGSETFWKAYQALHLLLPGTPMVYYGDEIAMTNGVIAASQRKDPVYAIKNSMVREELLFNPSF